MIGKHTDAVRVLRVRQLFEARSSEERGETGIVVFYGWLEEHYPHLLPSGSGDRVQQLKADLAGLFK
jgi:hypothetical protein